MPSVTRSRTVAADQATLWELLSDPHHLPRWWPQLERVEDVSDDAWTKVLRSNRGRLVRADYTRVEAEPPRNITWRHEIEESPFEAILSDSLIRMTLEPDGEGRTRVELRADQKLRGSYRFGGFMLRRATRRQLDEALDGLERAVGAA
ncbi:MAG: SRPBCC family protein [Thermoleophilaceae bacterium]